MGLHGICRRPASEIYVIWTRVSHVQAGGKSSDPKKRKPPSRGVQNRHPDIRVQLGLFNHCDVPQFSSAYYRGDCLHVDEILTCRMGSVANAACTNGEPYLAWQVL